MILFVIQFKFICIALLIIYCCKAALQNITFPQYNYIVETLYIEIMAKLGNSVYCLRVGIL